MTRKFDPVQQLQTPADWWHPDCKMPFFDRIYYRGDNSLDGHDPAHSLKQDQRTQRERDAIIRTLAPTSGNSYLDCPCGQGRHSLALARGSSFNVTGIDISGDAIAHAKQAAADQGLNNVYFQNGDMRDIEYKAETFDYVLNMFLSFGFFSSTDENQRVLHEFTRVLKSGGKVLIHTDVNPDMINGDRYLDRSERVLCDGGILHVNERVDPDSHRLVGTWSIEGDSPVSASYSVRIYNHEEIFMMMKHAGLVDVKVLPFFGISQVNDMPREIVYIGTKP